MPELPEIETLKQQLQQVALGCTIQNVSVLADKLRRPVPSDIREDVFGQQINNIDREGKFLLFALSKGKTLAIHLGMTGQLLATSSLDQPSAEKHLRIVFNLGDCLIKLFDIRKFGLVDVFLHKPEYIASLGVDPLSDSFNAEWLFGLTRKNETTIRHLFLNQSKISGIGNIYANDSLFEAGINPVRLSSSLTREECAKLVASTQKVLQAAISLGGTSMRDYVHLDGSKGHYQDHFLVYSKDGQACPRCKQIILKSKVHGRSSFFCQNCQK
ncbi:MAG: bifunctional DNA-formamidopyrimidine glycosylase/DNA-(apurinic or apyrimidinic site) lyase [Holosporales bacterium]|jgi:formamidopyrimidine-DNA glycosylase|nr:bifunctional DNA-formamidopyrimidine glycosylase/DNA-(apurinic or apyrimidinic site) lyase [Holosporales bacterium]